MVSITKWTGILFLLQAALTATALANATVGEVGIPHGSNITNSKSRKRQEIIFLRDDFLHKRNREGETIANIEKHGKSLSAEGNVFKGNSKADNYKDIPAYQGPALKEQLVKKYNGPPEIQENAVKKSDAYEVVSNGGDNSYTAVASEDENEGEGLVKVGHPLIRVHASDKQTDHFRRHHRSGLHIVSLDNDSDDLDGNSLREKDLRLYGSIGSPSLSHVRHKSHRSRAHHPFYQNDYIPPNVVSLSQDDFSGPVSRMNGHPREEIFPSFRRRDPFFFSQNSQLPQPEELMQRFQPVSPKSISYGDRPNMLVFPMYDGRSDSSPQLVPMTAQSAFTASPPQFGAAPLGYSSPSPSEIFRNGLLLQSALQFPQIQAQSVTPSYMMPSQSDGQIMFNNQQPDVRSLYQLQSQPQMQIPQLPMPQLTQPPPPVIPSEMQMTPELLSSPSQGEIGPANRWVDEDGRQRSEVLDRDRDRQDDDRPHDDRPQDDRPQDDRPQDDRPQDERNEDDDEDEFRNQGSRYYDRDDNSRAYDSDDDRTREDQTSDYQQEQSYSRDEEGPSDEESEDADEPEEESTEDANGRSYGSNGPATEDEQSLDSQPPDQNYSDDQEMEPQQDRFAPQRNLQQFNPRPMPRFMAPNRPLNVPNFPPMPPNTAVPSPMDAQTFSRYQLMSPSSALKEHILPKPREEPKPLTNIPNSKLQISQMSSAEAEYYENKAAMEPNFAPPIASKDTIPGKSRRFRVGLGNVLIRLNGKPLEDSSQLRSKIINGQIIQGKGKLIKSKGPVRVKLSHTKDAKHLKIIDIIAPKQFHVYDTKSKIRRPTKKVLNEANKTNRMTQFDAKRRA